MKNEGKSMNGAAVDIIASLLPAKYQGFRSSISDNYDYLFVGKHFTIYIVQWYGKVQLF